MAMNVSPSLNQILKDKYELETQEEEEWNDLANGLFVCSFELGGFVMPVQAGMLIDQLNYETASLVLTTLPMFVLILMAIEK